MTVVVHLGSAISDMNTSDEATTLFNSENIIFFVNDVLVCSKANVMHQTTTSGEISELPGSSEAGIMMSTMRSLADVRAKCGPTEASTSTSSKQEVCSQVSEWAPRLRRVMLTAADGIWLKDDVSRTRV